MIYKFTVTLNQVGNTEPMDSYFSKLVSDAKSALLLATLDEQSSWSLCEYVDAVDSGALDMDRALYRQAVAAIGEYLCFQATPEKVAEFAAKSWAANTLVSVVQKGWARIAEKPALRLVA